MRTHIMHAATVFLFGCRLTAFAEPATTRPAGSDDGERAMIGRSLVSPGDTTRLARILRKAQHGEPVTIGVIGGSITQGASATRAERRYGDLVAAWWRHEFPSCTVRFINAGIGATGSNYGALRARRDLLSQKPDLVVVEYGVNDPNVKESAETLEGLVRQILGEPNNPAVIVLFTMHQDGTNAQEWHGKVARHYGLPMVSYRDALWPEIAAGRLKWEDVEADVVHPNDRGHAYAARFITEFIARTLRRMPPTAGATPLPAIPAPLFSDSFEHGTLLEQEALKPTLNQGWKYDSGDKGWKTSTPGSTIEFEVEGTMVLVMHWVIRGPMGRAIARVDGGAPKELDGWFSATWGGYRQVNEVARGLSPGKHRVCIKLLETRAPESAGNEFRILGLGTAGATSLARRAAAGTDGG